MKDQALENPVVFISYSWTSPDYEEWVVNLATRLQSDGVVVKLDKWDLTEGQDKYVFMEQMVKSDEVNRVLLLCDSKYKTRADGRKGGVGDETQIVSPEIYNDTKQGKFIPVVTERSEEGKEYLPHFLQSRIYVDLSDEEVFEENYEKLIRNIYQVPLHQRPALGKAPSFVAKEEIEHYETSYVVKRMKSLIDKNPDRIPSLANDFKNKLFDILDSHVIMSQQADAIDRIVWDKITEMKPLTKDYIDMISLLVDSKALDSDFIIEFFEEFYSFTADRQALVSYYNKQFDHYKFLIHEFFLYTIVILIDKKEYSIVSDVVNAEYYTDEAHSDRKPKDFSCFKFYLNSLENMNEILKLNKITPQGHLLVERSKGFKNKLTEVDLLLYYISKTQDIDGYGWFPMTYIYFNEYAHIKILARLKSRRHFEKVKSLFNVNTSEELIEKFGSIKYERGYSTGFSAIPTIQSLVPIQEICTLP